MEQKFKDIRHKHYEGIVLSDPDPKDLGRYLVHFPEIQLGEDVSKGVWCVNQLGTWHRHTDTQLRTPNPNNAYGSYHPIKSGTRVMVRFKENDWHTGQIVSVISYNMPPQGDKRGVTSRDLFYLLMKTELQTWIHIDEPDKGRVLLSLHEGRSNILMQDEKVHITKRISKDCTDCRRTIEVHDDHIYMWWNKDKYVYIDGTYIYLKMEDSSIAMDANTINVHTPGDIHMQAGGNITMLAGGNIEMQDTDPVSFKPDPSELIPESTYQYIDNTINQIDNQETKKYDFEDT